MNQATRKSDKKSIGELVKPVALSIAFTGLATAGLAKLTSAIDDGRASYMANGGDLNYCLYGRNSVMPDDVATNGETMTITARDGTESMLVLDKTIDTALGPVYRFTNPERPATEGKPSSDWTCDNMRVFQVDSYEVPGDAQRTHLASYGFKQAAKSATLYEPIDNQKS